MADSTACFLAAAQKLKATGSLMLNPLTELFGSGKTKQWESRSHMRDGIRECKPIRRSLLTTGGRICFTMAMTTVVTGLVTPSWKVGNARHGENFRSERV